MIYPAVFEQKTGFDKIRSAVAERCLSSLGEEKVAAMMFSSEPEVIDRRLCLTAEFVRILQEEDRFPSDHFFDVRDALRKIRIEGSYLMEKELFDVRRSLETIHEIVRFFETRRETGVYPCLQELMAGVAVFPGLTKRIDAILDPFGRVRDHASPELNDIRQQLAQTAGGISRALNRILRAAQSEGLVDKDVAPAMRDGRLVIPVAPAFKRKIKGIVHDESATGKTVFIEPAEVVEANNKVRELEGAEKREIIRILTVFAGLVRPEIPEILRSYDFLAEIDFLRAKASFAVDIQALRPALETAPLIDWHHARHPLLLLSLRKQGREIVPLDIALSREKGRLLIISGPNAGGKSVCLKTVGLLQYMLQCGLLIPVHESSRAGVFQGIFIDIGDEQSIENDLSTYSSHLTNMKHFVKHCRPDTLLLIDEFGSGTEPQTGGAIAEALLRRFNERGSFGVITTHYRNLKHFADNHDGVVNGAMLYDRHGMQPLFALSIGNPGSSFAIEIARKTGLPDDVIADAVAIAGSDHIDMDKYLQDIVRDKRYWENKRQSIRFQEKKLEDTAARYETDLMELDRQRREIIDRAKAEAERLLSETNARIENTIRQIKEAQAGREQTRHARQMLDDFKHSIKSAVATDDPIARKIQTVKKQAHTTAPAAGEPPTAIAGDIRVGDNVRLKGQTATGTVLEVRGQDVTVAFGTIKSTIKHHRLEKAGKTPNKKENIAHTPVNTSIADELREKKLNFRSEIDLRGMRGDEALQAVIYFIDDAVLTGVARVRILHGTGTGALRQIVRDYLATVSQVKHFRDEHVQLGGAGITVVEM
jgi:DNA mismatch repair protein MutS2